MGSWPVQSADNGAVDADGWRRTGAVLHWRGDYSAVSDDRSVFEALLASQAAGTPVVLATVIHVQGSVPRHEGSKMLVHSDGSIVGTVGGGAMESLVIREGLEAIRDGK